MSVRIDRVTAKRSWLNALGMLLVGEWPGGEVVVERFAVVVFDETSARTVAVFKTVEEASSMKEKLEAELK